MKANQNTFILARAAALLVSAYSKVIPEYVEALGIKDLKVSKDAPNTYEALRAEYEDHRTLTVSTEHNGTSIYGAAGNLTFRIMHDLGHLTYEAKFTTSDEVSLARTQWLDLKRYLPYEWQEVCHVVYLADTVEQSLYESDYGKFPEDQKAFVMMHLANHFEGKN